MRPLEIFLSRILGENQVLEDRKALHAGAVTESHAGRGSFDAVP